MFFTDPPPPRTSCFHLFPPAEKKFERKIFTCETEREKKKKTPPCFFADRLGGIQEPSLSVLIFSMFTTCLESPLFFCYPVVLCVLYLSTSNLHFRTSLCLSQPRPLAPDADSSAAVLAAKYSASAKQTTTIPRLGWLATDRLANLG